MAIRPEDRLTLKLRPFGVPVRVHPSFFMIVVAVGANLRPQPLSTFVWVSTVLAVLLAGELAHALAFRALGYAPRIMLHWAGAETFVARATPGEPSRLIAAYLTAPATVLVLAGLARLVATVWPLPALDDLVHVATFWGVASLLPIVPLSGGYAWQVALVRVAGTHARTVARVSSLVVALLIVGGLLVARFSLPAFVLATVCTMVNASSLKQRRLAATDGRAATELRQAWHALQQKQIEPALAGADRAARLARSIALRGQARELAAWAHLHAGRLDVAEAMLSRLPSGHEPDPLLEGTLYLHRREYRYASILLADAAEKHERDDVAAQLAHALVADGRLAEALPLADRPYAGPRTWDQLVTALFYARRYDEARALGERWWARENAPRLAFNLACIEARAGRVDDGCRWLVEAVRAGWRDLGQLDGDPDLEPLRRHARYHEARALLTSLGRTVG